MIIVRILQPNGTMVRVQRCDNSEEAAVVVAKALDDGCHRIAVDVTEAEPTEKGWVN